MSGLGVAVGVWADPAALCLDVFLFFTASSRRSSCIRSGASAIGWPGWERWRTSRRTWPLLGRALVFFAVNPYGGEFGPTVTDPLFDL